MGLCKCPKRKVTTQFCYEHRVNVCEHCVVLNHPRCVVQSYLLWLQDSDYVPECLLCKQTLSNDDCVRLSCYHLFHWKCLDQYVRKMPETTAPAGYQCLSCKEPIIPNPLLASPVADALREKLSTVNWGRIGLGLPLTADKEMASLMREVPCTPLDENLTMNSHDDVIVNIEENSIPRPEESAQIPRRNPQGTNSERAPLLDDDENKYHRDVIVAYGMRYWVRLFSFRAAFVREVPGLKKVLLAALIFILFCIMLKLINDYLSDDSEFDVYSNPNVHVRD